MFVRILQNFSKFCWYFFLFLPFILKKSFEPTKLLIYEPPPTHVYYLTNTKLEDYVDDAE